MPAHPSPSIRGDRSIQDSVFHDDLLEEPIFPHWKTGMPRSGLESPDELQKQDPLATQIWKLYSRTKAQLPNQERMENLTWRMMAMSLRKKERERAQQQVRYVIELRFSPRRWMMRGLY